MVVKGGVHHITVSDSSRPLSPDAILLLLLLPLVRWVPHHHYGRFPVSRPSHVAKRKAFGALNVRAVGLRVQLVNLRTGV